MTVNSIEYMDNDARLGVDNIIGANLRRYRKFKGLTQLELAAAVDTSATMVQKYEHGQTRIAASTLYAFAKALDVEVGVFYYDQDDEEPSRKISSAEILKMNKIQEHIFLKLRTLPLEQQELIKTQVYGLAKSNKILGIESEEE